MKLELRCGANADLIYWSLRTPEYREYCRSHATGTTNLGLARTDFLAFEIPALSAERMVILNLLKALDAKIEANSRMVATLEEMARALFKSWFVDFGPVHAKADGRDTGLHADISAMFPDSFDDKGLPKGWTWTRAEAHRSQYGLILDVFKDAGLEQPDLAILSDEFLMEVRETKQPSLAVETLRRLLQGNIKARERLNIVEARKLSERLDDVLTRYHNRAVDSLQVIDELIALAREVSASASRGDELGMAPEELAFYDALAENGSARDMMERETLRTLAQLLVKTIRSTVTVDWTQKESVRAKMRIEVRKLLARYGYPPDLQKTAVDLVLEQANTIAVDWAL